jgi:2-furoyl-CoA dehydrogenase FAD binding subunit
MKAPPFDYVRPATVADSVAALARAGDEGKVLAGGQSLVPVLAMRLGRPAVLVDINAVIGLDELSVSEDTLYVGATVRQRQVEQHRAAAAVPLLAMAMPWIGHRELRGRGTVCGSLAHADPAAELPAVAACLNAALDIEGPSGRRTVTAREFFTGPMSTVLQPDELLLGARFPVAGPDEGFGFAEIARRHGDFALTGVATRARLSTSGEVLDATLAAFGVSGRPVVRDVTPILTSCLDTPGERPVDLVSALTSAMSALADEIVDTPGDMHASNSYRRRLFTVLAARELAAAYARAAGKDVAGATTGVRPPPGVAPTRPGLTPPPPSAVTPADGCATTHLTVNGTPVTLSLPPRVTLADTLRDHLGLTGTHLGCEHGICGMCTVLVDGQAARSCLLFAGQLEGAEILTIEGLGRPGELHPLQQAFGRHHALQCGFCTPGFLLSAYDLLTHKPRVTQEELAVELSGVLCRCTGYRNILSAVADVIRAHPDGITPPLNCPPQPR